MANSDEKVVPIESHRRQKKAADDESALTKKWGRETMQVGFTMVPAALLRGQRRLGIGRSELAVLLHLLDHWWKAEEMPWPSKETLAERLDCSDKTVQRALQNLEKAKLLNRKERYHKGSGGRTSSEYDLAPLVERLKEIAADIKKAEADAKATLKRAVRPGLKNRTKTNPA